MSPDRDTIWHRVAPGESWTDTVTVRVTNSGPTPFRVALATDGTAHLAPREADPAEYSAEVVGIGQSAGDAVWVGRVKSLTLKASGSVRKLVLSASHAVEVHAGSDVGRAEVTAGKVWVAASGGDVEGCFVATSEWAYVWAKQDLIGRATARGVVEATATRHVGMALTSTDDGVSVTAGGDLREPVTARYWTSIKVNGGVTGAVATGSDDAWASAAVEAGGDITGTVASSGYASLSAAGAIRTDAAAADGWLDLTANGDISGRFSAADECTLHAGKHVDASVTAGGQVKVTAGESVRCDITSTDGSLIVEAGGDVFSNVTVGNDIVVRTVGGILGTPVIRSEKANIAVCTGGAIDGLFEAEWVVDLRTTDPLSEVTNSRAMVRRTADERLTAEDSPWKRRLDVIAARLAESPDGDPAAEHLRGEADLIRPIRLTFDESHVPADAVRDLLSDPLFARDSMGPAVERADGTVVVSDVVGRYGVTWLLEPLRTESVSEHHRVPGGRVPASACPVSLLGDREAKRSADHYAVVRRTLTPLEGMTPEEWFAEARVASEQLIGTGERLEPVELDVRLSIVPLVGTCQTIAENGLLWQLALDLVGNGLPLFGISELSRTQRHVFPDTRVGGTAVKVAMVNMTIADGLDASRLARGIYPVGWKSETQSFGYFGDTFLRLGGLGVRAIRRLRRLNYTSGRQD